MSRAAWTGLSHLMGGDVPGESCPRPGLASQAECGGRAVRGIKGGWRMEVGQGGLGWSSLVQGMRKRNEPEGSPSGQV